MARPSSYPIHPQEHVLQMLREHQHPLSAYTLLSLLKPVGITAPPVVYRALEALIKKGKIHKVKELGAFVACNCQHDHVHDISLLSVCQKCQMVTELHDENLMQKFQLLGQEGVNFAPQAVIELPIICESCR